jgi:hypothetical protein
LFLDVFESLSTSINNPHPLTMSTSQPFRPHGFIKTPLLEALYLAAYTPSKKLREAHRKVHSTLSLMQAILYSSLFLITKNYVVNAQEPTIHKSLEAV